MTALNRILYIEDEADIRAIVSIALEIVGGFELQACSSAKQALSCAVSFAPELLLLDVMMPDMDGPSALKALRELPGLSDVPVIFMTAKVQAAEIAEYKSYGVLDVLSKPFDPMKLADQIKTIWRQRQ